MSDNIKHECGIALIRLLKPLGYYQKKYGSAFYGLNKLYLLMEKQHNRGQDGAGIATIKFDMPPGKEYIYRYRTTAPQPIADIFNRVKNGLPKNMNGRLPEIAWLKENVNFLGELMLGHLRYGTHGKNLLKYNHPIHRRNNWMTRNLILAGNFNLTNVDELFDNLTELGQHPREESDTNTILEKIGHFLDAENQRLFDYSKRQGYSKREISGEIAKNLDIQRMLVNATKKFDGGYTIAGLIGHGDAFVLRDPSGIRPAFYYTDDEIVVVASERPSIQTIFNASFEKIREIHPGHALIIKKSGKISEEPINKPREKKSCSFERIYFSRGNDKEIYQERKKLGYLLAPAVLKEIKYDLKNTVFSFIPNTAEVAFEGLIYGIQDYLDRYKKEQIKKAGKLLNEDKKLQDILSIHPRIEKIAIKDAKLRTFITEDSSRNDLVTHVYDITYGSIREKLDTIVIIDDSIVRGTTLKQSILKMLDRLKPKKIIIVSSAPQIRYPDCYGIDMSKMGDFAAFQAAVALLKDRKKEHLLKEIYLKCRNEEKRKGNAKNIVKELYDLFTTNEISDKIARLVKAKELKTEVKIIFQTIENLHKACPAHKGDWYFSGNYPTPGGIKVVNKAFINYMEKKDERAY